MFCRNTELTKNIVSGICKRHYLIKINFENLFSQSKMYNSFGGSLISNSASLSKTDDNKENLLHNSKDMILKRLQREDVFKFGSLLFNIGMENIHTECIRDLYNIILIDQQSYSTEQIMLIKSTFAKKKVILLDEIYQGEKFIEHILKGIQI